MTLPERADRKREAFRLFEEGQYGESLSCCTLLLESERDPALEVLAATNLFATGRLDDAELSFRDLVQKMPESSYVHNYLAKVLEAKGDDAAIAEYAAAIHLDPTNQDALRSYAGYLLSRKDFRGALPVLRRLVSLSRKDDDARNLVQALTGLGDADEALATHRALVGNARSEEYLDALLLAKDYRAAAGESLEAFRQTGQVKLLKMYLAALSQYDRAAALGEYEVHAGGSGDDGILADYILLLSGAGNGRGALDACARLLTRSETPANLLLACEVTAAHGSREDALVRYERLIRKSLKANCDPDLLGEILRSYRSFLKRSLPLPEALARFLSIVSADVNIACLLETARFYEDAGNLPEARSWYYRAYRADFLNGGLPYAQFLAAANDLRECEKVMLYILSNVKRSTDLHRVAAMVVAGISPMHGMRRLMDHLILRLDERRTGLSTEGLELLAMAYLIAARHALEDADYAACKRFCLKGIDVQPAQARAIRLEDFLGLISECKEHAIADRPVMDQPVPRKREPQVPVVLRIRDELGLDEQEQKIVEFLRAHKKATEAELRKALATRRIAGIVNRLIQKATAKKVQLIAKRGMGDDGEVYEYAGD